MFVLQLKLNYSKFSFQTRLELSGTNSRLVCVVMQGAAVGGVLVAGGGVVVSGPAHTLGANPDPHPDSDGDDEEMRMMNG